MKKIVLGILVFAIICVSITEIMIKSHTFEKVDDIASGENSGDVASVYEKTLDLNGTYDENDIEINYLTFNIEKNSEPIEIPHINGLRDKSVEDKINFEIEQAIKERVNEINKENDVTYCYSKLESNFANVLSLSFTIYYDSIVDNEEIYRSESLFFNYELINGTKLKLEDLFKTDADLHGIVRKSLFRGMAREEAIDVYFENIFYDEEKGTWMKTILEYDESKEDFVKKIVEFMPTLTEYDISKMLKKYLKQEEKLFYFTPSRVYLYVDDNAYLYYTEWKDIADEVVIYDKYLVDNTIYEKENIGNKNLWTCSKSIGDYTNYGFAEENLYYDISIFSYNPYEYLDNYPFTENYLQFYDNVKEEAFAELEAYRVIAKKNPEKMYFMFYSPYLNVGYNYSYGLETYYSLFSQNFREAINEMYVPIEKKEEVMEQIREVYRYYNLEMYNGILDYILYRDDSVDIVNLSYDNFEEKTKLYDARSLKEITSLGEIFVANVDYVVLIEEKVKAEIQRRDKWIDDKHTEEEIEELLTKFEYSASANNIVAKIPENDGYYFIFYYNEFDQNVLNIF